MSLAYTARQVAREHTPRDILRDDYGSTLERAYKGALTGTPDDAPHTTVICSCGDYVVEASVLAALTAHGTHVAEQQYAAMPLFITPPVVDRQPTRRRG